MAVCPRTIAFSTLVAPPMKLSPTPSDSAVKPEGCWFESNLGSFEMGSTRGLAAGCLGGVRP